MNSLYNSNIKIDNPNSKITYNKNNESCLTQPNKENDKEQPKYTLRKRKQINYTNNNYNSSFSDSENSKNEESANNDINNNNGKNNKFKKLKNPKQSGRNKTKTYNEEDSYDENTDNIPNKKLLNKKRKKYNTNTNTKKNKNKKTKTKKNYNTSNTNSNLSSYSDSDSNSESNNSSDDNNSNNNTNNKNNSNKTEDYIELRNTNISQLQLLKQQAEHLIQNTLKEITKLEKDFFIHEEEIKTSISSYPKKCIPISVNILNFDFNKLAKVQQETTDKLFDVIMMDPPWQLSSSQPTRGVAIAYDTLQDNQITQMPIDKLQTDGFIFIWTINAKYKYSLDVMKHWGYKYCDEITWVKQTVNGKIAKGHGYYLQHTKETCLIGIKGNPMHNSNVCSDVIFSKRRGQSQKPEEIYEIIEELVPNGYYLEIFGRRNNLRDYWVTIGNEI